MLMGIQTLKEGLGASQDFFWYENGKDVTILLDVAHNIYLTFQLITCYLSQVACSLQQVAILPTNIIVYKSHIILIRSTLSKLHWLIWAFFGNILSADNMEMLIHGDNLNLHFVTSIFLRPSCLTFLWHIDLYVLIEILTWNYMNLWLTKDFLQTTLSLFVTAYTPWIIVNLLTDQSK